MEPQAIVSQEQDVDEKNTSTDALFGDSDKESDVPEVSA